MGGRPLADFRIFWTRGQNCRQVAKWSKQSENPNPAQLPQNGSFSAGVPFTKMSHFGGDRDQRSGRRLRETTWKTSFCLAVKSIVFLAPKNVFGNCVSFGGQKCNFSRTKKNVLGNYVLAARNANAKLTCSPRINVIQKTIF